MEKLRERCSCSEKDKGDHRGDSSREIRVINCLTVIRVQNALRKVQFPVSESHKSHGDRIDNRDSSRTGKGVGGT